jgi:hypothetical protein
VRQGVRLPKEGGRVISETPIAPAQSESIAAPGDAKIAPVLIIDQREKTPLPFSRLTSRPGTLLAADYSISGAETLFGVERKTIPDLVTCCTSERERFERELVRLRGFKFRRLVIIGSETDILRGNFRSLANPRAILATLYCFEIRYDLPFVFLPTPELAGPGRAMGDLVRSGSQKSRNPFRGGIQINGGRPPLRRSPAKIRFNIFPRSLQGRNPLELAVAKRRRP